MINLLSPPPVNLKQVGWHLPRPRSQRVELQDLIPKRRKRPKQKLARVWPPNKSVSLSTTSAHSPKTDAWKVLAKLIEKSHGKKVVVDLSKVTLASSRASISN